MTRMTADDESAGQITVYLRRLSSDDSSAEDPLAELVYAEIRRMARRLVRGEAADVSVQATSLVNTVLLELVRVRTIDWADRAHFFRVASRLLRRRMIDQIRSQRAAKRPSGHERVMLDDVLLPAPDRFEEVLFVHQGLEKLAKFDAPLAELVELVYFGGVPIRTIAEMREVSEKTIDRTWIWPGDGWRPNSALPVPSSPAKPLYQMRHERRTLGQRKVIIPGDRGPARGGAAGFSAGSRTSR